MSGEATTPRGWFDFSRSHQPTGPIPAKAGIGCASSTCQPVADASRGVGVDKVHTENYMRGGTPLRYLGVANPGVADAALPRHLTAVVGLCRVAARAALGWARPSCSVLANSGKMPMSWQSPVNEI